MYKMNQKLETTIINELKMLGEKYPQIAIGYRIDPITKGFEIIIEEAETI